jgi:hypothetical protein
MHRRVTGIVTGISNVSAIKDKADQKLDFADHLPRHEQRNGCLKCKGVLDRYRASFHMFVHKAALCPDHGRTWKVAISLSGSFFFQLKEGEQL